MEDTVTKYKLLFAARAQRIDPVPNNAESNNVHVNVQDSKGYTSLHMAVRGNHVEALKLLLQYGAEIDATDVYGWTPLHLASRLGFTQIAEILINNGADFEARDNFYKDTPLLKAAWEGRTETALMLLGKGATLDETDADGLKVVDLAHANNKFEMHRKLTDIIVVERRRTTMNMAKSLRGTLRRMDIGS